MFLREHCGKLPDLYRKVLNRKYFHFLLIHEGKGLLRHGVLPYRSKRLPVQRSGPKLAHPTRLRSMTWIGSSFGSKVVVSRPRLLPVG